MMTRAIQFGFVMAAVGGIGAIYVTHHVAPSRTGAQFPAQVAFIAFLPVKDGLAEIHERFSNFYESFAKFPEDFNRLKSGIDSLQGLFSGKLRIKALPVAAEETVRKVQKMKFKRMGYASGKVNQVKSGLSRVSSVVSQNPAVGKLGSRLMGSLNAGSLLDGPGHSMNSAIFPSFGFSVYAEESGTENAQTPPVPWVGRPKEDEAGSWGARVERRIARGMSSQKLLQMLGEPDFVTPHALMPDQEDWLYGFRGFNELNDFGSRVLNGQANLAITLRNGQVHAVTMDQPVIYIDF